MKMRSTTSGVAAVTVLLGIVAAACGSSSNNAGAGATTAAPTTAATTAAASTTAAAGETTTSAGGGATGNTLKVDTSKCPADATTALPAGADIKIGFPGPQTGPLAAFGAIGQGIQLYFDKVAAEQGGIDGHKAQVIAKDDAYDPNKSPAAVTELIEKDKIMASAIQIGTPNVAATQKLYEDSCTPQAFVGTGFPDWGDPAHHPWTVGGILAYNTEAKMWGEFIAKKKPGAKVARARLQQRLREVVPDRLRAGGQGQGLARSSRPSCTRAPPPASTTR